MANKKIKMKNKKENIFKFIKEINLPKEYANNLIDKGFDKYRKILLYIL